MDPQPPTVTQEGSDMQTNDGLIRLEVGGEKYLTSSDTIPRDPRSPTVTQEGSDMQTNDGLIRLEVGGEKYLTSSATIARDPHSHLASIVLNQNQNVWQRNNKGEYVIERNGELFRYVLNFLRDGCLLDGVLPRDIHFWKDLYAEAEHFNVISLKRHLEDLITTVLQSNIIDVAEMLKQIECDRKQEELQLSESTETDGEEIENKDSSEEIIERSEKVITSDSAVSLEQSTEDKQQSLSRLKQTVYSKWSINLKFPKLGKGDLSQAKKLLICGALIHFMLFALVMVINP